MRRRLAALAAAFLMASWSGASAQVSQYTFTVNAAEAAKIGRALDADIRETTALMQKLLGQTLVQERAAAEAAKDAAKDGAKPQQPSPPVAPTQPKE